MLRNLVLERNRLFPATGGAAAYSFNAAAGAWTTVTSGPGSAGAFLVGVTLSVRPMRALPDGCPSLVGLEAVSLSRNDAHGALPDIVPSIFLDAVAGPLSAEVLAAYDAPFPSRSFKAGLRQLTALIPLTRNDPGAAIGRATMAVLKDWHRPFLTAYSDGDPATAGWEKVFQELVPGAQSQDHTTVTGAGHFIQEQKGSELGRIIAGFVRRTA